MQILMQNISFKESDGKLADMFGEKAQKIAQKLEEKTIKVSKDKFKEDISTTQYRKFYEKVLELSSKATQKEFDTKTKPFVKMLNSKVAYSKTRKLCGDNFVTLMNESIKKVNSYEELQNFKYFLESIIGFMPKK